MKSNDSINRFDPLTYVFNGCSKIEESDLLIIQTTFREFIDSKVLWMGIEFQVWLWSRPKLLGIYLGMANNLGIIDGGKSLECLLELAVDIIDLYLNNPYHNSGHAFDVAFMVYYMLEDLGVAKQLSLTKSELISLFVGALGHDMGHPGLNNIYQINANTELSQKYKNKSVLENYSIDLLYDLLDKNLYLDIIFKSDQEQKDLIRNLIKILILNTDMVNHFDMVNKLVAIVESQPAVQNNNLLLEESSVEPVVDKDVEEESTGKTTVNDESFTSLHSIRSSATSDPSSEMDLIIVTTLESRYLLISSILHAADISNPARPFFVSKIWSEMVMEEFFLQGDKEKSSNLPVSPSMDREVTNGGDVATGFTNLIVQPFFDLLSVIFPRMDCFSVLLRNNAQRREVVSEPSPIQPLKMELGMPYKTQNTGRKVSMAAGMIEIKDDLISSMSGRIKFKRKHPEDSLTSTRRHTQDILEE